MRRLTWDQYRRNRTIHAFAKEHGRRSAWIETIEHYFNDRRGYPSRVRSMPPCVFRRRPL